MCGRYSLNLPSSKTSFKKETIEKYPKVFDYVNGDIAPSTFNPIIFKRQDEYIFEFAKWGFEYDWLPKGKLLFNVRSEIVFEKSFSNNLIKTSRCLIPFNCYFEWKTSDSFKEKYKVYSNQNLCFFAGIYSIFNEKLSFSILTKQSAINIEDIHHRNPIILTLQDVKGWFAYEFKGLFVGSDVELIADIA